MSSGLADTSIARNTLLEALHRYLESNGRRLLAMISTLGQEAVDIESTALYGYYRPTPPLMRVEDAIAILCEKSVSLLSGGVELICSRPPRLRVRRKYIEELLG